MELRVIASAYACEPNKGSEPGIGWNIVRQLARWHKLWVITRANNRPQIEQALEKNPVPNLSFVYFDLPQWARWWKKGTRGLQLYYYLWQIGAYQKARQLHEQQPFDIAHHVTFGRYWTPSFLSLLPVPFVWGPVGGGESMPPTFWEDINWKGQLYERTRNIARWVGEHDPFVRATARHSSAALPTTRETARTLKKLGVDNLQVLGNAALNQQEMDTMAADPPAAESPIRFASIGRLLHWKGFHLGLRAFAQANLSKAEYWIIGEGPEQERLQQLAAALGIDQQVTFWGSLPRAQTLQKLQQCHSLLHPSLHDSGGWVCIEAMAAGRPVVCLNLGGPALMVTNETGFKIDARDAEEAITDLRQAIQTLANNHSLRDKMSHKARHRARKWFTWEHKAKVIQKIYQAAASSPGSPTETTVSMADLPQPLPEQSAPLSKPHG